LWQRITGITFDAHCAVWKSVSDGTIPAFMAEDMKSKIKPTEKPESKSLGTLLSEKMRERANKHTDQQREESIAKGIAIIYGGGHTHVKANNRG
jgi:hypothetical protein